MVPTAQPSSPTTNASKQTPGLRQKTLRFADRNPSSTQHQHQNQQQQRPRPRQQDQSPILSQPRQPQSPPSRVRQRRPLPSSASATTSPNPPKTEDTIVATPPKPKPFIAALRAPQSEPRPPRPSRPVLSTTSETLGTGASITVLPSKVSKTRHSMATPTAMGATIVSRPSLPAKKKVDIVDQGKPLIFDPAADDYGVGDDDNDNFDEEASPEDEIQAQLSISDAEEEYYEEDNRDEDETEDETESEEAEIEAEIDVEGDGYEDEDEGEEIESEGEEQERRSSPVSGRNGEPSVWSPPFSPQVHAKTQPQPRSASRRARSSSIQNPPSSAARRTFRHSSPILDIDEEAEEAAQDVQGKEKPAVAKTNGTKPSTISATTTATTTASASQKGRPGDQDSGPRRFNIDTILEHRPSADDPNLFELLVRWDLPEDENDEENETWEPEDVIHRDAPRALFAYWRRVEGGREGQMEDSDLWYISHVKQHRVSSNGKVDLQVSWVGSPQATWEPEASVVESAPDAVAEYWEKKGGRDKIIAAKAGSKKRGAGGRRGGGPQKRARRG